MPANADLATVARDAFGSFAVAARALLPAFQKFAALIAALAPLLMTAADYRAGHQGDPRDWSMPDAWHRGYLRGRLQAMRERGRRG
jgi:hypothetical protein